VSDADRFQTWQRDTLAGRDDTTRMEGWEVEERGDETVFAVHADSSIWRHKSFRLHCTPGRFTYGVTVEGTGELADVSYFAGYWSAQSRWGSGSSSRATISFAGSTRSPIRRTAGTSTLSVVR
jgi:hypothetical protein